MDTQTLIESIESFTDSQRRKFNQHCKCKLYDKSSSSISPNQTDQVINASNAVDELSASQLMYLNMQLTLSKQLSKHPC